MSTIIKVVSTRFLAPLDPKAFCVCFVGFVVLSLVGVACFNWSVNPYGQYSSVWMSPIVQDSRKEKVDLFETLGEMPEGLVLGSSRALKFEPDYLESRTSLTFFNFAVNHGRPEDFLAIVRYYQNRFNRLPKMVLIGVDLAALNDDVPSDARLCSESRLFRFARDTTSWSECFDRFGQLFSYQQLTSSFKSIRNRVSKTEKIDPEQFFRPDGVIRYVKREKEMETGCYDFEAALAFNRNEFLSIFGKLTDPSPRRLSYLRETLRFCKANDCKPNVFTTVSHPSLRETLGNKTKFLALEEKSLAAIESMANEYGATFVNFGTVETFAGDPDCFVDGIHPLEPNTRRMIDRLLSLPSEATYAIQ